MKGSCKFLILSLMLLLCVGIYAQEKKEKNINEEIEKKVVVKVNELDKLLSLSSKQKVELNALFKEYYFKKEQLDAQIKILKKEQKKIKINRGTKIVNLLNQKQKEIFIREEEKKKKKN